MNYSGIDEFREGASMNNRFSMYTSRGSGVEAEVQEDHKRLSIVLFFRRLKPSSSSVSSLHLTKSEAKALGEWLLEFADE